jgi:hypothetical protein
MLRRSNRFGVNLLTAEATKFHRENCEPIHTISVQSVSGLAAWMARA